MTRLLFAQNNGQWKQLLTSKLLHSNTSYVQQKTPDCKNIFVGKHILLADSFNEALRVATCTIISSDM